MSTSQNTSSGSQGSANKSGASGKRSGSVAHPERVCIVQVGAKHFAVDVKIVGEVFVTSDVVAVPRSPAAVLGLFNLRGVPVPLVSLDVLAGRPAVPRSADNPSCTILVLRPTGGPMAGLLIDRMDVVADVTSAPDPSVDDDLLVGGLLPHATAKNQLVRVLDTDELRRRLDALRFR